MAKTARRRKTSGGTKIYDPIFLCPYFTTTKRFVTRSSGLCNTTAYTPAGQSDTSTRRVCAAPLVFCSHTKRPCASKMRNCTGLGLCFAHAMRTASSVGFGVIEQSQTSFELRAASPRSTALLGRVAPQFTVTVKEHSEDCPLGATARHVFVVTPTWKIEPLAQPFTKNGVNTPAQLSDAVGWA